MLITPGYVFTVYKGSQWALYNASVQKSPMLTLANTNFEHMGLNIDPC
jgi:hypothetical protein